MSDLLKRALEKHDHDLSEEARLASIRYAHTVDAISYILLCKKSIRSKSSGFIISDRNNHMTGYILSIFPHADPKAVSKELSSIGLYTENQLLLLSYALFIVLFSIGYILMNFFIPEVLTKIINYSRFFIIFVFLILPFITWMVLCLTHIKLYRE